MYSDWQLSLVWDVQKSVDIYICLKSSGDDIIQLWPMTYQVLTYLKGQTKRHRCYFLTDLHKIDLLFMAHRSRSTVNMWVLFTSHSQNLDMPRGPKFRPVKTFVRFNQTIWVIFYTEEIWGVSVIESWKQYVVYWTYTTVISVVD